jgi:serine/threonine-protein kinase
MTRSADGDLRIDSVLRNTYQIVSVLGRGGMGSVFLAQHLRLPGKQVAIKVLRSDERLGPDVHARFRREADIASRLGHPNIVEVLDFDTLEDGSPFLVLEYLRGESLADRLRFGPLPLELVFSFVRQMGSALQTAHRAGIVHRDLKPANIFLVPTDSGGVVGERVKLLDFGISKVIASETVQTQEAVLIGTPQYMSPEQAQGRNSQIDARTDVFALGCIVFEMLAGTPPFGGESLVQIIYRIVHEPPASLATLAPGTPAHVLAAVERALAKKPEERYPDVASFIADLTGSPLHSLPASAGATEARGSSANPSGIARPSSEEGLSLSGTLAPGSQASAPQPSGTARFGQDEARGDTMGFGATMAPGTARFGGAQAGGDTSGLDATLPPRAGGTPVPGMPAGTLGYSASPAPSAPAPLPSTPAGPLGSSASPAAPSPVAAPTPAQPAPLPSPAAPQAVVPAVPPSQPAPTSARAKPSRMTVALGMALVVGAVGLVWRLGPGTPPPSQPPAMAEAPAPRAETQPAPSVPAALPAQPPAPGPTATETPVVAASAPAAPAVEVKPTVSRSARPAEPEAMPDTVRELLKEGERALAGGNAQQAIDLARQSQRTQPTAAARSLLARAYCLKKDLGGAKAELRGVAPAEQPRVKRFCKQHDTEL